MRIAARMSISMSVHPISATIAATSRTEPCEAVTRFSENIPRNGSTNGWVTPRMNPTTPLFGVGNEQEQDDPEDQKRLQDAECEGDDARSGGRAVRPGHHRGIGGGNGLRGCRNGGGRDIRGLSRLRLDDRLSGGRGSVVIGHGCPSDVQGCAFRVAESPSRQCVSAATAGCTRVSGRGPAMPFPAASVASWVRYRVVTGQRPCTPGT